MSGDAGEQDPMKWPDMAESVRWAARESRGRAAEARAASAASDEPDVAEVAREAADDLDQLANRIEARLADLDPDATP